MGQAHRIIIIENPVYHYPLRCKNTLNESKSLFYIILELLCSNMPFSQKMSFPSEFKIFQDLKKKFIFTPCFLGLTKHFKSFETCFEKCFFKKYSLGGYFRARGLLWGCPTGAVGRIEVRTLYTPTL